MGSSSGFSKRIALIGGEGRMGQCFVPWLQGQGHTVRVSGPSEDPGYDGLLEASDVVIVSVPIAVTRDVIERIAPRLRADQLLSDFTSVKQAPVEAMLESPASVIGCHPVFGPMASAEGQNAVLCPVRPGDWLPWYRQVLEAMGIVAMEMSPREHDEAMGIVQGLTHFINISFARTLAAEQADLKRILAVCSPVYRIFFTMACRILSGDPALYSQIQTSNPENSRLLEAFLAEGEKLRDRADARDESGLQDLIAEAGAYLGPYREVARRESEQLVEAMVRIGKGGTGDEGSGPQ